MTNVLIIAYLAWKSVNLSVGADVSQRATKWNLPANKYNSENKNSSVKYLQQIKYYIILQQSNPNRQMRCEFFCHHIAHITYTMWHGSQRHVCRISSDSCLFSLESLSHLMERARKHYIPSAKYHTMLR